jgi:acyl-CoA thioester hydrolase
VRAVKGFANGYEVTVRFAETDAQGIAHHASFVVWLEVARVAYLAEHAGGYRWIQEQGVEALTTAVHVRYVATAAFDDILTIWTRCVDLRGARFRCEYNVMRADVLVADGYTDHAMVDAATHRPLRIPTWFADAVARAELSEQAPSQHQSPA